MSKCGTSEVRGNAINTEKCATDAEYGSSYSDTLEVFPESIEQKENCTNSVSLLEPDRKRSIHQPKHDTSSSRFSQDVNKSSICSSDVTETSSLINFNTKNYTRLEVVTAKEIRKLLMGFHGFVIFGILFSIAFVIIVNTAYAQYDTLRGFKVRYYSLPFLYELILSTANIISFMYALSLSVIYTSRTIRLRKSDRTHEQVWVVLLTVCSALYLNPYESVVRLMLHVGYNLRQDPWYDVVTRIYDSVRDASFTASTIFYVWATVNSYRVLEGKLGLRFYIPKVLAVVFYMFLKQFAFWKFNLYMSEMPIASFVAMLHLYRALNSWPLSGIICVSAVTLYEILMLLWIFREIKVTRGFLKARDYMKHRTKQVGLRFFLYHNLMFYFTFWLCYLLLLLGLPLGPQLASKTLFEVSYVEVQHVPLGLTVLYLSYVTLEAYMNLPADAIGFRGWFYPQSSKLKELLEPVKYRQTEVNVEKVQTNCFVMETNVMMFNFAWLVYYYEAGKVSKLSAIQTSSDYKVEEMVFDQRTDTRALVLSCRDRIVVSFRGTKSSRNLRTNLKAFQANLGRILPTSERDVSLFLQTGSQNHPCEILSSPDGRRAKIHRGFADAYRTTASHIMSSIKRLRETQRRPLFLTGHSLGGALATICAFDCVLSMGFGSTEIHVTTYGSPRVGNAAFRNIYDEAVPSSWRVTISADIITKLPKVEYAHVGKKVMLTTAGDLFIDPNSLELSLWSGEAASLLYHRKSSYLLAMKSWCNRYGNGSYNPAFWNWPVSSDDEKRWPGAIKEY